MLVYTTGSIIITTPFRANIDAQAGAYASGILAVMVSAACASRIVRNDANSPKFASQTVSPDQQRRRANNSWVLLFAGAGQDVIQWNDSDTPASRLPVCSGAGTSAATAGPA